MLQKVIETFREFIVWPEYDVIPIVLGSFIANLGKGDAVYLLIVGPPASGKTEFIRSLGSHKSMYELSKLTPRTFISGYITKGKVMGKDKSLLVRPFPQALYALCSAGDCSPAR